MLPPQRRVTTPCFFCRKHTPKSGFLKRLRPPWPIKAVAEPLQSIQTGFSAAPLRFFQFFQIGPDALVQSPQLPHLLITEPGEDRIPKVFHQGH